MNKFEDIDVDALRNALGKVSSAKAIKRLIIAPAYADGVRGETLSERHSIPRATVYSWLDRFESQSISDAIENESRPGRPPKLNASQRERLSTDLAEPSIKLGYDAPDWSPELAQSHIEQRYGVAYSLGHVRRLLRKPSID